MNNPFRYCATLSPPSKYSVQLLFMLVQTFAFASSCARKYGHTLSRANMVRLVQGKQLQCFVIHMPVCVPKYACAAKYVHRWSLVKVYVQEDRLLKKPLSHPDRLPYGVTSDQRNALKAFSDANVQVHI